MSDHFNISPAKPLVANRAKLEALVGTELSADAFTFQPWGERLVVVREAPVGRTAGGIIIPRTAQEYPTVGWILSIGDRVDELNMPVRPRESLLGCKVLFGHYAGQVLTVGDADDFQDPFNSRYTVLDVGSLWGLVGAVPATPVV